MRCDLCSGDHNEVFILRKDRYSKNVNKRFKNASRVCWNCALLLFRRKYYNFGQNWRSVFLDSMRVLERNRIKYMEIWG